MFSLLGGESDLEQRIERTLSSHPELAADFERDDVSLEELFDKLPDGKFDGAHLARASWMHWLYALLASTLFLGLIMVLFQRGDASLLHVTMAGVVTATAGVLSLVMFQYAAIFTASMRIYGRGIVGLLMLFIKLIGFSYACALDPSNGFWLSFFGFTFGVGLCEELIKAVPIMAGIRNYDRMDWRGACMLGLASGVGFGVAEGIMYSSDHYNGVATFGIYLVRFVSCVGLHAIWAASVGILLSYHQEILNGEMGWGDWGLLLAKVQGVPMVLHGLYDTLLKQEHEAWALLVALLSFAWLAGLMLYAASGDEEREPRAARSAA